MAHGYPGNTSATFEALGDLYPAAVSVIDTEGTVTYWNSAAEQMFGWSRDEVIGHPLPTIPADQRQEFQEFLQRALRGEVVRQTDIRRQTRSGSIIDVSITMGPLYDAHGAITGTLAVFADITEHKQTEEMLTRRVRQQAVLAELGQRAIDGLSISSMMDEAVVLVSESLEVEYSKVLELLPDEDALLLRAGVGWKEGYVGQATFDTGAGSQAGYTLKINRPVIVEDLRSESRFSGPSLLHEHGVVSGVSVVIHGIEGPLGVLGAHTRSQRTFSTDDIHFVQAIANLLGSTISRNRMKEMLEERETQYRSIFETTRDGLVIVDTDGIVRAANPAMSRMHGYAQEEMIGLPITAYIHEDYHHLAYAFLQSATSGNEFGGRMLDVRKDGTSFHVERHGIRFIFKGRPHVLGVVRDITEQVQAYDLLEQRVQERTRELSTLLQISSTLASTIELDPLLELILDQLKRVADYTCASIFLLDGDKLQVMNHRGVAQEAWMQTQFEIESLGDLWEVIQHREAMIIDNLWRDTPVRRAIDEVLGGRLQTSFSYVRSLMVVPLLLKNRLIGLLTISSAEPNALTTSQAELALAIANQAAVAIENARLYEQAQQMAVLEERQRLARDLHDSVTQALYGIAIGAETARAHLSRDPAKALEPLDYVISLAKTGLAEMRTLIFELHPGSLDAENLRTVIRRLVEPLRDRHGLEVQIARLDEPEVPHPTKEVLYRTTQEALHNVVKHAQASRVQLRLESTSTGVELEICDDGVGLDPLADYSGHMGLRSMRERAAQIGGVLQIESEPGKGTCVRLRISANAQS